ncbi:MAG: Hsp20/alpha crystallin family protein [Planctomycetia bacterium]|nr:Hsp20/alpha crystallin family protein [Planctomycetia bacterium]
MSEPIQQADAVQQSVREPRHVYTPALDIYETEDGLVLEADLPSVKPENLEIRVQDNVLHLFGKVTWPVSATARLIHEEIREEDFYRSFILSDEVDTEQITADFSDGVLKLTLPKAPKTKPRKIEVRTGKSA